jgi:hypothetical protein
MGIASQLEDRISSGFDEQAVEVLSSCGNVKIT